MALVNLESEIGIVYLLIGIVEGAQSAYSESSLLYIMQYCCGITPLSNWKCSKYL